jgi:hypothetical protein
MDPRFMETQLTGFFEGDAHTFVVELYTLLVSAETNGGIPPALIEQEKQLLRKQLVIIFYLTNEFKIFS